MSEPKNSDNPLLSLCVGENWPWMRMHFGLYLGQFWSDFQILFFLLKAYEKGFQKTSRDHGLGGLGASCAPDIDKSSL